jgi:hypothetical protein
MEEIYRYPQSLCPNCGTPANAASTPDDERAPQPGDVAICLECHHITVYGEGMHLRNPTGEEMIEIAGDKNIVAMMKALAFSRKIQETLGRKK